MSKIVEISTYDEATNTWKTPVPLGASAENVELINGNNLEAVIGDYSSSTPSVSDKLSKILGNSQVGLATIQTVNEAIGDTSTEIRGEDVDASSGDTLQAFAEKYNKRGIRIDNAIKAITSGTLEVLITNNIAAHRSIYRNKNLVGTADSPFASIEALAEAVAANDFENIFVGDFFDISLPATSLSSVQTVRLVVMDINYYMICSALRFTKPHLILMPQDCLVNDAKMNDSDSTSGGYMVSKMHTTILPVYENAFKRILGESHVLAHPEYISTNIEVSDDSSEADATWTKADITLRLANSDMAFGTYVLSGSKYDIGISNRQLAGFVLNPDLLIKKHGYGSDTNWSWWLSSTVNSSQFAFVTDEGDGEGNNASLESGIVPVIVFG